MSDLGKARKAFDAQDLEAGKALHQPKNVAAREPHGDDHNKYLGDAVYGATDGIITTFAVVAGVAGASLSSAIVLILGLANLLGDGLSMASGAYLGERSDQDLQKKEREREEWEVKHFPEGEREEIRQIYKQKGFRGADLERAVDIITSDREQWVNEMMLHELEIIEERKDPLKSGIVTFVAFLIAGAIPLLAYTAAGWFGALQNGSFWVAVVVTLITIFGVGSARSLVTQRPWYRAGLEMLVVGGVAALVAYLVGYLLRGLV